MNRLSQQGSATTNRQIKPHLFLMYSTHEILKVHCGSNIPLYNLIQWIILDYEFAYLYPHHGSRSSSSTLLLLMLRGAIWVARCALRQVAISAIRQSCLWAAELPREKSLMCSSKIFRSECDLLLPSVFVSLVFSLYCEFQHIVQLPTNCIVVRGLPNSNYISTLKISGIRWWDVSYSINSLTNSRNHLLTPKMAQPLTELARKYTHPIGPDHKIIAYTGKSGMSPVHVPLATQPGLSQNQRKYILVLEAYQRGRFHKFTVQQLVDLEAFAPSYTSKKVDEKEDREIDFANLQSIPIHPLFAKSRWKTSIYKHVGKIPLGNGRPGYFEVSCQRDL